MASGTLDISEKQKVSYAVPLWLRDEQIRSNIKRVKARIERSYALRADPIAVVCFGPSLNETWEQVKDFKYIISCSGSHKFLVERGVIPTWHLEVDPRQHKVKLIGPPHPDVEYLIASTCHPDVVDHLKDCKIRLWHVFDTAEEGQRLLPYGEWAITGGCSVGLRAMTMARFLGFTKLHVFGMDGSSGTTGKHAAEHPNQAKQDFETTCNGRTFYTTPAFLEAARTTFHELDQMTDVRATFYGDGLVQEMAKSYKPHFVKGQPEIAFEKPELISREYVEQNRQLHATNLAYGVGAGRHAPTVLKLAESIKTTSILDYGCGKGYLAKEIPYPIWEYDPAVESKSETPRPADLVVCLDVLEHIEPDKLKYVLRDLARCTKLMGYFVINTGPARKTLPDGRNTHLIQENEAWWKTALSNCFTVTKILPAQHKSEIHVLVQPINLKKKAAPVVKNAEAHFDLIFAGLEFQRQPYVIGVAPNVFSASFYQTLTSTFPTDVSLYKKFTGGDEKYSLSERHNSEAYHRCLSAPAWKELHAYFKGPEFLAKMGRVLKAHKIPVDVAGLRTRFEFSMLPAHGGLLRPHTDLPSKVLTLIFPMIGADEEWDPAWGGGTDVLEQVDAAATYADYQAPNDVLRKVHAYDYAPNRCVVFVKSAKSWHSVGPLAGPEGRWRKSITVNLERVE